eukprot:CAMPEP_0117047462 /NCGR_PEP_ID=MMETSP0472-20121206/32804_1 /TAXON_ID=693140 ORGANISM="Tiarina fusus, Strain LIS" /NCGR_SAMPLE_ID=MMETSP0472 /ASSEMBLY_ACC=CAM_ASM_000603 /LENGTH=651 /DNA_ID=CAMNT_0004760179 /DNA_START=106 /DNA_END=2061 /DNA_ORIENTATION=-
MPRLSLSVEYSKLVITDWDRLKGRDNYELTAGKILFQHLFEKCPEAKPLFGFAITVNPRGTNLLKSTRFARHAKFLIRMVDKTVDMLGAETTSDEEHGRGKRLTDILTELGRKHVAYGVKPEFFPFMTESLLLMLKETIGNPHEDAWNDVFEFLINNMTEGYQHIQKGAMADKYKGKCIQVWKRLSEIQKYKENGGVILFQHLFSKCPETKVLFGFPVDIDPYSETLLQSKRFSIHASFLMEMMEKTVGILGEDDETLTTSLIELGQRHVSFGVKGEYFPFMTNALIYMLKELLGADFSTDDEQAFEHVMAMLIADMIRGQRTVDKDLAGAKKEVVVQSWSKLTKILGYEKKGGILLFQHLFESCPESKLLFGFPLTIDPKSDALLENQRFLTHATFLLTMIEKTVGLLGEADDELTETLLKLGKKHFTYGVRPEYFPFMTQAIIKMLKEMIGGEFTEEEQKAWEDILGVLIADMVRGERMLDMGLASANKNVTSKNWEKLAEISDYDEVAGLVVFENLFKVCPQSKPLFGFKLDFPDSEIRMSKRVLVHASFIIEMIEKALGMLGKDDKELAVFLEDLGRKHIAYAVTPEHMPYMQDSIIHMLKEILGKDNAFTKEDEEAWQLVLSALVANMSKAQREMEMKKIAAAMVV